MSRRSDNFAHNTALAQTDGFINGQRLEPVCDYRFGIRDLGYCGCGVIAFKNALLLCDMDISLAQAAYEMESATLLFGLLGVNMFAYSSRLRSHGLHAKKLFSRKKAARLLDGSVILLAYFLKGHIFRAHIVTAKREGGGYTVYNHSGRKPESTRFDSFDEIICGGKMILAYEITKAAEIGDKK